RISDGLDVLQYFTTREWVFYNDGLIKLYQELSTKDKNVFRFIMYDIDIDEYLKNILLGARQYCMKEDLS
ncbi:PREDICTED: fatty acyl-CoA reductase 1-like, partial [Trachymyrmex septentrionalis]|uniref:fatty acyl-CoA reductase 1-like n=1 Tax=Trachymyrmex septentrionalis TaxID=34720 RepID=UPI00084F1D47